MYCVCVCVRNIFASIHNIYILHIQYTILIRYTVSFHLLSKRPNATYKAHAKSTKLNVTKLTIKYIYKWYKYEYNPFNNMRAFGFILFFFFHVQTFEDVHNFWCMFCCCCCCSYFTKNGRKINGGLKRSKTENDEKEICNLTNSKKWNEFRRSVINPFGIHLKLWGHNEVNAMVCVCTQHLRVHDSMAFEYGYIFFSYNNYSSVINQY